MREVASYWEMSSFCWMAQKQFGLCYLCLNGHHLGNQCPNSKPCNIQGCKKTHHPLLHDPITKRDENAQITTLNTIKRHEEKIIVLRTFPVIPGHGNKWLLVNCFLDKGSTTTYVNEDAVKTLGITTFSTVGIGAQNQEEIELTPHEKIAQKKVEQSLAYNGERCEVAVPWKHERPNLSNNRQMAERRLELVEQRSWKIRS